ncbi:MAG: response regulator transcription factor [Methyloversatilis sp.]|uniref:response regulator transcription factor n=1 Tax=Methyloversatilis sp. TaxID=2569862 RepID=UPI0025CFB662|nr:response regulator transcription factor [Methyloversatilis sp.]MCR6668261.1 response regulator transcription factor [Methyloversatilis sp.]
MQTARIALLEDDPVQVEILGSWLCAAGHDIHTFMRSRDLMREAVRESYDLLLIDWELPDLPGADVLRWLRNERGLTTPVIFVTARQDENDIVTALAAGADDYIVKPARRMELLTRIEAVLRRSRPPADQPVIDAAPYQFDMNSHTARLNGEVIDLTEREFELAVFLFRNVGRLVSRGHLLESLWGRKGDVPTRTVDTHMSRVRSKLALRPENGYRLASTYNYGYRLERVADDGKRAEEQPAA